jgi:hypothetical protein
MFESQKLHANFGRVAQRPLFLTHSREPAGRRTGVPFRVKRGLLALLALRGAIQSWRSNDEAICGQANLSYRRRATPATPPGRARKKRYSPPGDPGIPRGEASQLLTATQNTKNQHIYCSIIGIATYLKRFTKRINPMK